MGNVQKLIVLFSSRHSAAGSAIGWVYSCGKLSITDGIWATDKTLGSWLHIKLGPRWAVSTICQDRPSQKHLHTFEWKIAATIENWRKLLPKLWGLRVAKYATVVWSRIPFGIVGCNCFPGFANSNTVSCPLFLTSCWAPQHLQTPAFPCIHNFKFPSISTFLRELFPK